MNFRNVIYKFLLHNNLRAAFVSIRYFWFSKILRRFYILDSVSQDVSKKTIEYNISTFKRGFNYERTKSLLRPFSVIETLNQDSHILVIGPRSEDDIFYLKACGFRNITGVDLFTYSPHIKLGDMHELPFQNNSFDAVIIGWTLVYSNNPKQVASEILRVTKHSGLVGIGAEQIPEHILKKQHEESMNNLGYTVGGKRLNSADEHLDLFNEHVDTVYYKHDLGPLNLNKMSNLVLIFSIK